MLENLANMHGKVVSYRQLHKRILENETYLQSLTNTEVDRNRQLTEHSKLLMISFK